MKSTILAEDRSQKLKDSKKLYSFIKQKKKKKMYGVLGLDSIEDESYRQYLLMYKPQDDLGGGGGGGEDGGTGGAGPSKKYSLYPFGMSENLFLPKSEHENIKRVFKRFQKSIEQEFEKDRAFQVYMD
jgi:hypothetical protein